MLVMSSAFCPARPPLACTKSLSLFRLLQVQCASWRFSIADGWPPFATGMMWSTHGLNGSGYFRLKSTSRPQIPQTVCVAKILFLFLSNWARWGPSLSGRFLSAIHFPPGVFFIAKDPHRGGVLFYGAIISRKIRDVSRRKVAFYTSAPPYSRRVRSRTA